MLLKEATLILMKPNLLVLLLLPLLQGLPHRLHNLGDALKRRVWLLLLDRILRLLKIIGCAQLYTL